MNNILLITKDMEYCKKLINNIHKEIKDVIVCCIANSDEEISYSLLNYNIDIILMDLTYIDYKNFETKKIIGKRKFKNSIILISDTALADIDILNSPYVYDYIVKNNDISILLKKIKMLAYTKKSLYISEKDTIKEVIIKEKIKNELLYLGYNLSHKGTKYLIEVIYVLSTLKGYDENNLEKDIYPIIGKKYRKSVNTIRGVIRFATDTMTYECEEQKLKDYLNIKEYIKPGTKNIIEAIMKRLEI